MIAKRRMSYEVYSSKEIKDEYGQKKIVKDKLLGVIKASNFESKKVIYEKDIRYEFLNYTMLTDKRLKIAKGYIVKAEEESFTVTNKVYASSYQVLSLENFNG